MTKPQIAQSSRGTHLAREIRLKAWETRAPTLARIAVHQVGAEGGGRERLSIIPVHEILFCFTAGAISSRRIVISASWGQTRAFRAGTVYVRTDKGLFATRFRTLARFASRLDHNNFGTIHRSVLVNLPKIIDVYFAARLKQVSIGVNGSKEELTVSRRNLKFLRLKLGI